MTDKKFLTHKESWSRLLESWNKDAEIKQLEFALDYTREFPSYGFGWVILGSVYSVFSQYDLARRSLSRSMNLCERVSYPAIADEMGCLYERRGSLNRAKLWFRKAVDLSSGAIGLFRLGEILVRLGEFQDAKRLFRLQANASEEEADIWLTSLGLVLRSERKYSEAVSAFSRALESDSNNLVARMAMVDCEKAQLCSEDSSWIWDPEGAIADAIGKEEWAHLERMTRLLVARFPSDVQFRFDLALVLNELSLFREAREVVLEARENTYFDDSLEIEIANSLGRTYEAQGDFKRAALSYRQVIEAGDREFGYLKLGNVLESIGDLSGAMKCFKEVLRSSRDFLDEAHFRIGWLHCGQREYENAIRHFEFAIELDSEFTVARRALRHCEWALVFSAS